MIAFSSLLFALSTASQSSPGIGSAALPATAIHPANAMVKTINTAKKAIVIPVEEQVDFGMHAFLKRSVAEALAQKPDVLIFQVNTFGGELQAAFDIVDLISGITACSTYVYVEKKAISAGALISLSCNRMVMGRGTTIGDCAPITQSQDGIQMLGEKIQSPLRAKFRNLAERNGYPSLLSQAMVSMDKGVVGAFYADSLKPPDFYTAKQWEALADLHKNRYSSHKWVVQEDQLLTMTDQEASRYGFSQGSYASLDAFIAQKGWKKQQTFAATWSEKMVRFLGTLAPLLMLVGFGALYLEFKTPGLSVFGLIGFLCLALVFGSKYAVGLANYTELVLLVLGFMIFMLEMWLFPGTFLLAGIGILAMMAAIVLSLQDFTVPNPDMPWEMKSLINNLAVTVSMAVLALTIPIMAARWLFPRLPKGMEVISEVTLADSHVQSDAIHALTVGQMGITHTPLRPVGKAEFDGKIHEVQSRGEFIEQGVAVTLARIAGNTLTVHPTAPGTAA
jgi:membrane-bound serine protease (ClpP class)